MGSRSRPAVSVLAEALFETTPGTLVRDEANMSQHVGYRRTGIEAQIRPGREEPHQALCNQFV